MNVIRTIRKEEDSRWVNLLFSAGPHTAFDATGRIPYHPPVFPFAGDFHEPVVGGFLYVVFRGTIVGYGKISSLRPHFGEDVGIEAEPVAEGEEVVLEDHLSKMPFHLDCRGFTGRRYVEQDLHEMTAVDAQAVIANLGLMP